MKKFFKLIYELIFGKLPTHVYIEMEQFPIPEEMLSDKENLMLILINEHREKIGLQPYKTSIHLWNIANFNSKAMNMWGKASHDFQPQNFKESKAYMFGECVSQGYGTAELNFQSYMNSKGHRENIESKDYEYIAISDVCNFNTILTARYRK